MSDADDATRMAEAVLFAAGSALRYYEPRTQARIIGAAGHALAVTRDYALERAARKVEAVGNYGDMRRDELSPEYDQPRFDMMLECAAAIRAMKRSDGIVERRGTP